MAALSKTSDPPEQSNLPVIDMETFEQILELDEDEKHEFSADMVWQYFSQATVTFTDMDDALYVDHSLRHTAVHHLTQSCPFAVSQHKEITQRSLPARPFLEGLLCGSGCSKGAGHLRAYTALWAAVR